MLQLKKSTGVLKTLVFQSPSHPGRSLEVDGVQDWKSEHFVKSVATVLTGVDHTKLRESLEVVDVEGRRLYYLEKL